MTQIGKAIGLMALASGLALAATVPVKPESLKGVDAVQAMQIANEWGKGAAVQSFVTPEAVSFNFSNGQTVKIALPPERMVVAIAPYVSRTHPCKTHYMSSCQGELVDTPVKVMVKTQDGKVIYQGNVRTLENGFLELWLPRNQALVVSLEAGGGGASGLISTFNTSDTCITTFQLR